MICDRKFIAKDIQMFYEEQIDKKEVSIKKGERTLNSKKEKYEQVLRNIEEMQKEDEKKQNEFQTEMENLTIKMEVIQNKIKEINNENEVLNKRIQSRNEDANKKQDEKFLVTGEVDSLKKEIETLESRVIKLRNKFEEVTSVSGSHRGRNISGQRKRKDTINEGSSSSLQSADNATDVNINEDPKSNAKSAKKVKMKHNTRRSHTSSIVSKNAREGNTGNSGCNCTIF